MGYRRMIGVRNSHDKSVAAGLVAGARVTVCANGMFTGEDICLNRKHTSRIFDDLDQKIVEGFEKVFGEWERNDLRIMRYRETEISDERAHDLIIRSVDAEALPPSTFLVFSRSIGSPGMRSLCQGRRGAFTTPSLK